MYYIYTLKKKSFFFFIWFHVTEVKPFWTCCIFFYMNVVKYIVAHRVARCSWIISCFIANTSCTFPEKLHTYKYIPGIKIIYPCWFYPNAKEWYSLVPFFWKCIACVRVMQKNKSNCFRLLIKYTTVQFPNSPVFRSALVKWPLQSALVGTDTCSVWTGFLVPVTAD